MKRHFKIFLEEKLGKQNITLTKIKLLNNPFYEDKISGKNDPLDVFGVKIYKYSVSYNDGQIGCESLLEVSRLLFWTKKIEIRETPALRIG
ncbi:hypothetical protein BH09BAC1_BH09BAC1_03320 [soil metagenome]